MSTTKTEFASLHARIEKHLHKRLEVAAKKDRRSVTAFLNCLIEKHVPRTQAELDGELEDKAWAKTQRAANGSSAIPPEEAETLV